MSEARDLAEKKNILIVDDDINVWDSLKELLNVEGYYVDSSSTGDEANRKIMMKFYSLALLDLKLPDMSGLQVLRKIHTESPRTVVIMVTGYPTLDNAVESINLGAAAYIMKPIKPDDLLSFIKSKLTEQDEKTSNLLDNTLPSFLSLLQDSNLWSTENIAQRLGVTKTIVEKMCSFCAMNGIVKYWPNQGIVKIDKPSAS